MAITQDNLLTPRSAARIRQLDFFARTRVEGFLKGANASRLKGTSAQFMQHRLYVPGDDLRHLDWRVFGRTDRLVTREFEEFTNLDVVLALDCSGSMAFGSEPMSKIEFTQHCAALLGYLFNLRNDRFGLAACTQGLSAYLQPSSGRIHLAEFFRKLVSMPIRGETQLHRCATLLLQRLRRRSVVIFLSDGYEDPHQLTRAMGQLALRGHDVLFYQVIHEEELDLNMATFTLFQDLETGQLDGADPLEIRSAYREVVEEHQHALKTGAARFSIDYHAVKVTADWDMVLAALLHQRAPV